VKEIVVISGKGGTGKTSVTASLAVMAGDAVMADCDVDAADLHLILAPRNTETHEFYSGNRAVIREQSCMGCGACKMQCRFDAIRPGGFIDGRPIFRIDPVACEGCGVCVRFCPLQAIDFPVQLCGKWMVAETRCGPMVHARLGVAAENSGKLVSVVRSKAREIAEEKKASWLIVDGPPGIGCPVIASVTGADAVLAVTEPTLSGKHDLDRVARLVSHFKIPLLICVNKWDLNPAITADIEQYAIDNHAYFCGKISYDPAVTHAQVNGKSVVEYGASQAEGEIRQIWETIQNELGR